MPVRFGFCPLPGRSPPLPSASRGSACPSTRSSSASPEMMFWTPCAVASWPDSGIGFSFFAFRAVTTAFARPSLAAATRVDLVPRPDEHLLEDRPRLLVVPAGHELLRALLEGALREERLQDRVVPALEEERVVVRLAAVQLGDDRLLTVLPVRLEARDDALALQDADRACRRTRCRSRRASSCRPAGRTRSPSPPSRPQPSRSRATSPRRARRG